MEVILIRLLNSIDNTRADTILVRHDEGQHVGDQRIRPYLTHHSNTSHKVVEYEDEVQSPQKGRVLECIGRIPIKLRLDIGERPLQSIISASRRTEVIDNNVRDLRR